MERLDVGCFEKEREEPRGYSNKYWINAGKRKLIKYTDPTSKNADIMESLASFILKMLNVDTVDVLLGYNSNQEFLKKINVDSPNCCIIDNFLKTPSEIVINLLNFRWVKVNTGDKQKDISSCFYKMFQMFSKLDNISEDDFECMKMKYIRMVFADCIIDNEDRRIKNIEAIFDEKQSTYRLAPSFDNALAFNTYNLSSNDGYCYIGNQSFEVKEILKYIINHYYDYVADIIENLDLLIQNDLDNILKLYKDNLTEDNLAYISDYLNKVNNLINSFSINKKIR